MMQVSWLQFNSVGLSLQREWVMVLELELDLDGFEFLW
jgi:hypothetical protein